MKKRYILLLLVVIYCSSVSKLVSKSQSSSSQSSGSLSVGQANSSSSSTSSSSENYTIKPLDNVPSVQYEGSGSLLESMKYLTSRGYTTLATSQESKYVDSSLDALRRDYIGQYRPSGKFWLARLNNKSSQLVNALSNGVYKINHRALVKAIQSGEFCGDRLFKLRLLIQEFFLGQLATILPPFVAPNGVFFSSADQKILKKFNTKVTSSLKMTRYMRNGLDTSNSGSISTSLSSSTLFEPISFFTGIILVNNSDAAIGQGETAVMPGMVGFLPSNNSGSTAMNVWNNINSNNFQGLYTRQPMSFGIIGAGGGPILLTPSQDKTTVTIEFVGKTYTADNFEPTAMKKFFATPQPWAIIVVKPKGNTEPVVAGLATLSVTDFGKYLTIDKKVSSQLAGLTNFTLYDVINTVYSVSNSFYQRIAPDSFERYTSNNAFTRAMYLIQGLINGILEASTVRPLADANNTIIKGPVNVAIYEKRIGPNQPQIYGLNSGIDSLFLRSLRITRAVLTYCGISTKLLESQDSNNVSLFIQALQNPNQTIYAPNNQNIEVSGTEAGNNSGLFLPSASSAPVQSQQSKRRVVVYKGEPLYIGSMGLKGQTPYLPIIKVMNHSTSSNTSNTNGVASSGSNMKGHEKTNHVSVSHRNKLGTSSKGNSSTNNVSSGSSSSNKNNVGTNNGNSSSGPNNSLNANPFNNLNNGSNSFGNSNNNSSQNSFNNLNSEDYGNSGDGNSSFGGSNNFNSQDYGNESGGNNYSSQGYNNSNNYGNNNSSQNSFNNLNSEDYGNSGDGNSSFGGNNNFNSQDYGSESGGNNYSSQGYNNSNNYGNNNSSQNSFNNFNSEDYGNSGDGNSSFGGNNNFNSQGYGNESGNDGNFSNNGSGENNNQYAQQNSSLMRNLKKLAKNFMFKFNLS